MLTKAKILEFTNPRQSPDPGTNCRSLDKDLNLPEPLYPLKKEKEGKNQNGSEKVRAGVTSGLPGAFLSLHPRPQARGWHEPTGVDFHTSDAQPGFQMLLKNPLPGGKSVIRAAGMHSSSHALALPRGCHRLPVPEARCPPGSPRGRKSHSLILGRLNFGEQKNTAIY